MNTSKDPWFKMSLVAVLTIFIAGCGGGGGGGNTATSGSSNQAVGGIWQGQYTLNGISVTEIALVTENGEFFAEAKNLSNGCVGLATGSMSSTGSNVSGTEEFSTASYATSPGVTTGCVYPDGSTWGKGTFSGTIAQRSSATLTFTETTAMGTALPSVTVNYSFLALYNETSSLAKIAGNWASPSGDIISIGANGSVFAQDPATGCVINGNVSIINANYNAYSVSDSYANCQGSAAVLNGLTANGIITLDDQVSPNQLIGGATVTLPNGSIIIAIADSTKA